MAVVLLDHVRKELPDSHEVRDYVDLEGLPDLLLGFLEDGPVTAYTGVVDEDRGFSVCLTDFVSHGLEAGWFCDVTDVEGHVFGCFVSLVLLILE